MTDTPKKPNLFAIEQAMERVYDSIKPKVVKDFQQNRDGILEMMSLQAQLLALQVESLENAGFSRTEALQIALLLLGKTDQGGKEKPQSKD